MIYDNIINNVMNTININNNILMIFKLQMNIKNSSILLIQIYNK